MYKGSLVLVPCYLKFGRRPVMLGSIILVSAFALFAELFTDAAFSLRLA